MGRERTSSGPREFRFVLPEIPTLYPVYVIRNKGGSTCVSPNSGFEAGTSASTWRNNETGFSRDQLSAPENGGHPAHLRRGWVYMSLYRNYIPGPDSEADPADGWCRYNASPAGRYGRHTDGVTGARVADRPETPTGQLALRAHVVFASLSVAQLTDERYRRGTRPPDHQPMTHTCRRRFDRPTSASRPNRTLMATNTPDRPSDRTESDSDCDSSDGRRHR